MWLHFLPLLRDPRLASRGDAQPAAGDRGEDLAARLLGQNRAAAVVGLEQREQKPSRFGGAGAHQTQGPAASSTPMKMRRLALLNQMFCLYQCAYMQYIYIHHSYLLVCICVAKNSMAGSRTLDLETDEQWMNNLCTWLFSNHPERVDSNFSQVMLVFLVT